MVGTDGGSKSHGSGHSKNLYIVLGTIIGMLAVALIVAIGLLVTRRMRKKLRQKPRIFPGRPVTPLDDAEFNSWRRPSTHSARPEKHSMTVRHSVSVTKRPLVQHTYAAEMPSPPPPAANVHTKYGSLEKELASYENTRSRQSTLDSDRPPSLAYGTMKAASNDDPDKPFASAPDEDDIMPWFPDSRPTPPAATSSPQGRTQHIHYPSVSETSEFEFGFGEEKEMGIGKRHEPANGPSHGMI